MDAAACIGCGVCVAACPNASASLFTGAKIPQLALLPQGHPERERRVRPWSSRWTLEGFGGCSNHGECEAACPKGISIVNIARMRREYVKASRAGARAEAYSGARWLSGSARPNPAHLTGLSVGVPIRAAYIALSRTGSIRETKRRPRHLAGVLLSPCFFTLLLVNQDAKRPGYAS